MAPPRLPSWIIAICLWLVQVQGRGETLLIARSGDFFSTGMLESIPGTVAEIQNEIDMNGFPTSHTINFADYSTEVTGITNDPFNGTVYYSEMDTRSIYRIDGFDIKFENPNITFTKIYEGISDSASSIAFDWITKTMYWTDHHFGSISMRPAYLSSKDPDTFNSMYRIIVSSLSFPLGLAVDPTKGYMFWFDMHAGSGRIERATMAGLGRTPIAHRTLDYVVNLAVDPAEERLYYVDSQRMVIESISYYGHGRRSIRKLPGLNLISMALTTSEICVAEPDGYFVACFYKTGGANNFYHSYWFNPPRAVSMYDEAFLVTDKSDACANHKCEHMCAINGTATHVCVCKQGYTLNNDSKNCTADLDYLPSTGILISNGTNICMSEVRTITGASLSPVCIKADFNNSRHLAADAAAKVVFYFDDVKKEINAHRILTGSTTVLASAGNVTGISYDWITKNLFWAETDTGEIHVVNVDDQKTSVVYSGIHGLGPMSASPHNKSLFWMSEATNGEVSVFAGSMDGNNSTVIVHPHQVYAPSALYADPSTGRVFYLDFFTLTAINPDGSDPVVLFSNVYTSDLIIYKRYALWIAYSDGFLYGSSYLESTRETQLHDSEFGLVTGVAVFDVTLQIQELGPCNKDPNGGCSDICLPSDAGPVCKCSFGYFLKDDNKTCTTKPLTDNFLLISDVGNYLLYQVSLDDGNNVVAASTPYDFYVTGSLYHDTEKMVYITDASSRSIFRMALDGTNKTTVVQFSGVIPERLAIDYSTGMVYYTVSHPWYTTEGYVGVFHPTLMVHTTLLDGLDTPRGLAVFPSEGLMFIADYGYSSSTIDVAYMDGTNRRTIVEDADVGSPTGVTLDYIQKRLYWADNYNDVIWHCHLDGSDIQKLASEPIGYLTDVAIQGNYVYYTGTNINQVMKVSKETGHKEIFMEPTAELGPINTVSIYPGDAQPANSDCQDSNGGCSTFCLAVPFSRKCGCEDGVILLDDKLHCQGVKKECTKEIPFGSLIPDPDCFAIEGYKCRVGCVDGYRRNSSHTFDTIECLNTTRWNHDPATLCEPVTCPVAIPNGKISETTCDRTINSVCSVQCNTDYVPNPQGSQPRCQSSGFWTPDPSTLCVPIVKCTETIQYGILSHGCTEFSPFCSITCNPNYTPHEVVRSVHCREDGRLSVDPNKYCQPISCPSLDNVVLESSCLSEAGKDCTFTCIEGFVSIYNGTITCRTDRTWTKSSNQLCRAITCEQNIPGIKKLLPSQPPEANKEFSFTCNAGYVKNNDIVSVRCLPSGSWSVGSNSLCSLPVVTTSDALSDTGKGIGYGVLTMVILIIIVVLVGYLYFKKRRTNQARFVESPNVQYSENEFHNPTAEIGGESNPYSTMGSSATNPYDNLPEMKTTDAPESATNGSSSLYHKF